MMRLYVISKTKNGQDNLDGHYYLITDKAEIILETNATSLFFARLYFQNDENKKIYEKMFPGGYSIEFLKTASVIDNVHIREFIKQFNR